MEYLKLYIFQLALGNKKRTGDLACSVSLHVASFLGKCPRLGVLLTEAGMFLGEEKL
jgi:hypothetical protein